MMKKYKALIFREWKIVKRFYILRAVLILFFAILVGGVLVYISQEPSNSPEEAMFAALVLLYLLIACVAVVVGEDNGVYKSDVDTGWLRFSWALPLTAYEKTMTRYLLKGIVILVGTMFALVAVGIIFALVKLTYLVTVIYAFFWCLDVALLYDLLRNIIIMRAVDVKTLKKMCNIGVDVLVGSCVLSLINMDSIEKNMEEMENFDVAKMVELMTISDFWGCVGILLLFVLLIVGFVVIRKNYERRNT